MARNPGRFPSTHWSEIDRAGSEPAEAADRPEMAALLLRYTPALSAHLRARGAVARDRIDDTLQAFFAEKVLDASLLTNASPARGRFRNYLLTSLDRFVISRRRYDAAEKRGAGAAAEPLRPETQQVEERAADAFDVEWARLVLGEAMARMRLRCEADGRVDVWSAFECRVLRPILQRAAPPGYAEMVERFSYRSPTQLWNAVRAGKQLFARLLREVVAEYASDRDQVEDELADLRRICSRFPQDGSAIAYPA